MRKSISLFLAALCLAPFAQAQNTLAGNLTVQQTVKLTGAASPAQITANVNDYAPAGFSTAAVLRLQSDVPRTITGLAGGVAGRMVWLTNVGSQTISLATESVLSTAANRFAFGASGFDLSAGGSLSIWYDTTSNRWRAATNLAAGGGGTTVDQTARDAAAAAQATADSKQPALANATTLAKVSESAGLPLWDGAAWPGGGSGGTGTVTSVSVVTANGVSGSVANASTTPAITLALGAITPASVTASGTVTGSNLSGTNTGDQTSVTGNAGTATKLATARAINGVSFDGTAAITVPAAAGTLTGSTLASGVTASSLTSAAGGTFGTAAFTAATAYDPAGAAATITLAGLGGVPTSRTVNGHALSGNVTVTPSDLSLAIGTNTQAWSAKLDSVAALASGSGWLHNDGADVLAWSIPSKSDVGLGSVENTALSTWTGSANLSTVGTVSAGTWHGTAIADTYIASAATWNAKVSFPGFGTSGTTAAVGNDARLSDARTPTAHNQAWSTIISTPTTVSGYGITDAQGLDSDLTALATNATNGLWARTGAGTGSARTITGTTDQVIVTNGDGVSDNPTLSLPQSIATGSTPTFAGLIASGNVAIGTTSPAAQLHLRSGSANIVEVIRLDNPTNINDNGSKIVWRNADISNDAAFFAARRIGASTGIALTFGTAAAWTTTAATEKMRIAGNGNVGIGNTNPLRKLDVVGDDSGNGIRVTGTTGTIGAFTAEGTSINIQADSAAATRVLVDAGSSNAAGFVALNGGSSGYVQLGTGGTARMQVFASGVVKLNSYGAGTLTSDSSGNITASSDKRLKNVQGKFTRGLDAILQLQPKVFTWKTESGMNPDDINVGFIAQDVLPAIPEAVGQVKTNDVEEDDAANPGKKVKKSKREAAEFLTLADRPIIAALVNAVKELKEENDTLRARLDKLEAKK